MENRIREQQLQIFADRTSCHRWGRNIGMTGAFVLALA